MIRVLLIFLLLGSCQKIGLAESSETQLIPFFPFGKNTEEPDQQGTPPSSNATGSRGDCPRTKIPFIPLVGTDGYHRTISDTPIIFVYSPYQSKTINVILQDESETEVFRGTIQPKKSGILALKLPVQLKAEHRYQWYLSVECASENPYLTGQIELLSLDKRERIKQEMALGASPLNQLETLANSGIWYDLLSELTTLQKINPDNTDYLGIWNDLLMTEVWQPLLSQYYNSDVNQEELQTELSQQEIIMRLVVGL